jgi:MerR family transcriptional regulator, copper efflux regulator
MTIDLERLALRHGIRPGRSEAVGAAAARLGTTPRMLRYREALGLVAPGRAANGYRSYDEQDLLAAAFADEIERRRGVTPAAVAFALRALAEPEVAQELNVLARLARRREASPATALDFETRKARRLLRLAS